MAQERDYIDTARDDDGKLTASTAADADDGADETEQIKEQINETRSQLGETIEAIQEKLSFANIQEQISEQVNSAVTNAKDAVLEATVGKVASIMKNISNELARSKVSKSVMDNPLPFLLIGAGAGLLIYQGYSGSNKKAQRRRSLASAAHDRDSGMLDSVTGAAGNVAGSVSGAVSGAAGSVSDAVSGAAGTVSGAASNAYGKLTGAAGSAVSTVRDKAGELGSVARDQYDTYIEENPLAVGAVALAIGAAVGFAIPSTSYEGQLMGPVRQDLVDRASEAASGLIDRGKDLVSEASKNISEAATAAAGAASGSASGSSSTSGSGSGSGSSAGASGSSTGSGATGSSSTSGGSTGSSSSTGSGSGAGTGTGTGSGGSGSGGGI